MKIQKAKINAKKKQIKELYIPHTFCFLKIFASKLKTHMLK